MRILVTPATGEFFGMRVAAIHRVGLILALAIAPGAALAQDSTASSANAAYASASPADDPMDEAAATPDNPLTPEETEALGNALLFDPSGLSAAAPAKPLRLPSLSNSASLDVNRKSDSSGTIAVKQLLPADYWDAKIGADLSARAAPSWNYQPDRSSSDRDTGAAWASLGVVPDLATVDARVDPSNDQGKLGTTLKRAVPLGDKFNVTVQNNASVTETYSASSGVSTDLPLISVPAGVSSALPNPHVWGNELTAKFDILPTGTAIGAKYAANSVDTTTHNTLSAEQKIYGPLHVTTAVTDIGQSTVGKSITAGFKLSW